MYSLNNVGPYQFPPEFRIRNQASFLVKKLTVTLCQAQEMVSFYYGCKSWKDLMHFSSIATIPPDLLNDYDNTDANHFRDEIQKLIDSNWKPSLTKINKLTLIPHSVTHSIANGNLKSLYDEEVIALYYHIYEDDKEPKYSIYNALRYADNSILTHIHQRKNSNIQCGHLTDHRYGFTLYYMFQIKGDSIRLIIRELDSLFYPSSKEHTHFKKEWFINYTYEYIKHLINCLEMEYNSEEVVLHRVSNHDCIINDSSPIPHNPYFMNTFGEFLILKGGVVGPLLGESDERLGVALTFNSNR